MLTFRIVVDIKSWMISYKQGHVTLDVAYEKILSLMGENTESVSGSITESSVSHVVRDRNAKRMKADS